MEELPMYTWVPTYRAIADAIYDMRNNRDCLARICAEIFNGRHGVSFPKNCGESFESSGIDPFTFFASFNRGLTDVNRQRIIALALEHLDIKGCRIPDDFAGIPVVSNFKSWFFGGPDDRSDSDVDGLWNLFCCAMEYADASSKSNACLFVDAYDAALKQYMVSWNLTMGLYWVRPDAFINLDAVNRQFLKKTYGINLSHIPTGSEYLALLSCLSSATDEMYPAISMRAWWDSRQPDDCLGDEEAGDGAEEWLPSREEYDPGISTKQWAALLENRNVFVSQAQALMKRMLDCGGAATCKQLSELYGESMNFYLGAATGLAKRVAKATNCPLQTNKEGGNRYWPVLFQGRSASSDGPGVFEWRIRPELEIALGQFDLSKVPLYSNSPNVLQDDDKTKAFDAYSDEDFLNDVFIDSDDLTNMKALLKRKKNLILQGAPGTGKTYAAKRLAYAAMGEKDESRIEIVQFHQNTSYDDIVIGYRPDGKGGFEILDGVFTRFCKRATSDSGKPYFFIIDEINRANISKVFGELLMLIEADHRGDSITLPVGNMCMNVPENVYIIGMMNTADRGLALIDYALRRRFAFFEMKPALEHPGFVSRINESNNEKLSAVVKQIVAINKEIAADPALGSGFCIGHSYFCLQGSVSDEDVEGIVRYEIEPLIAEYWFDDQQKVRDCCKKLENALR